MLQDAGRRSMSTANTSSLARCSFTFPSPCATPSVHPCARLTSDSPSVALCPAPCIPSSPSHLPRLTCSTLTGAMLLTAPRCFLFHECLQSSVEADPRRCPTRLAASLLLFVTPSRCVRVSPGGRVALHTSSQVMLALLHYGRRSRTWQQAPPLLTHAAKSTWGLEASPLQRASRRHADGVGGMQLNSYTCCCGHNCILRDPWPHALTIISFYSAACHPPAASLT
jgi:hypothetical protein